MCKCVVNASARCSRLLIQNRMENGDIFGLLDVASRDILCQEELISGSADIAPGFCAVRVRRVVERLDDAGQCIVSAQHRPDAGEVERAVRGRSGESRAGG